MISWHQIVFTLQQAAEGVELSRHVQLTHQPVLHQQHQCIPEHSSADLLLQIKLPQRKAKDTATLPSVHGGTTGGVRRADGRSHDDDQNAQRYFFSHDCTHTLYSVRTTFVAGNIIRSDATHSLPTTKVVQCIMYVYMYMCVCVCAVH